MENLPVLPVIEPNELVLAFGELHMLTFDQKRYLAALLESGTPAEATRLTGLPKGRHQFWLRSDTKYAEAVRRVGTGLLAEARAKLDSLSVKAADAFEEALDAESHLDVVCPSCNHEFGISTTNLKLRLDVAKEVFKRTGDLTPRSKVEVEVKHRDMTTEDRIVVAQIERAYRLGESSPVPPDVLHDLQRRGLLPEAMPAPPGRGLPAGPQGEPSP